MAGVPPPAGPGQGTPPVDKQMDGWVDGQTRVKTLPSRRTTYAVGKNLKAYSQRMKAKHFFNVHHFFLVFLLSLPFALRVNGPKDLPRCIRWFSSLSALSETRFSVRCHDADTR